MGQFFATPKNREKKLRQKHREAGFTEQFNKHFSEADVIQVPVYRI